MFASVVVIGSGRSGQSVSFEVDWSVFLLMFAFAVVICREGPELSVSLEGGLDGQSERIVGEVPVGIGARRGVTCVPV